MDCTEGTLHGVENVTVYLDDILLTGSTEVERLHHLQEVLARLEKAGIRLKRDNVTQLRSFLGLFNYYSKFPPHSLSLLAPCTLPVAPESPKVDIGFGEKPKQRPFGKPRKL